MTCDICDQNKATILVEDSGYWVYCDSCWEIETRPIYPHCNIHLEWYRYRNQIKSNEQSGYRLRDNSSKGYRIFKHHRQP